MNLNQDFKEFIKLLNYHKVEYLLVGGYAVGYYGYPRYTGDIDIWINATEINSEKIIKVLDDFGFSSLNLTKNDFKEYGQIIQLGFPPNRIDLITNVSGLNFEDCYPLRSNLNEDDYIIDIIDLESLKRNKRATGRLKDLNDIENLT